MATGVDGFGLAGEFTVEDLERMPEDGRRYELLDGILLVSPVPGYGIRRLRGRCTGCSTTHARRSCTW